MITPWCRCTVTTSGPAPAAQKQCRHQVPPCPCWEEWVSIPHSPYAECWMRLLGLLAQLGKLVRKANHVSTPEPLNQTVHFKKPQWFTCALRFRKHCHSLPPPNSILLLISFCQSWFHDLDIFLWISNRIYQLYCKETHSFISEDSLIAGAALKLESDVDRYSGPTVPMKKHC